MSSVLFDEAHGQLLRSEPPTEPDEDIDTSKEFQEEAQALGMNVALCRTPLDEGVLKDRDVLVIVAPTTAFSSSEVQAIVQFVRAGRGLLIAANAEAIWRQKQREDGSLESFTTLAESLGLRFEQYFNVPPDEIRKFMPHYLTSGISALTAWDLSAVAPVADGHYPLASLNDAGDLFAIGLETGKGRVVAFGDFIFLGDRDFDKASNRQFAHNVLRWLAFENPIDCLDARVEREIPLGQSGTVSVTLRNPQPQRLERVRCLLESDAGALISEPVVKVRSIPPSGQIWLQWNIEPQRLGRQSLRLTIDWPRSRKEAPVFFDRFVEFNCTAHAILELRTVDAQGAPREQFELYQPFVVEGRVRWQDGAKVVPIETDLRYPRSKLRFVRREAVDGLDRWHLEGIAPGDYRLTYGIIGAEQPTTLSVRIKESLRDRIARIQQDMVEPLDAEALRLMSRIRGEFASESVRAIPFRLLTPEEYVKALYPLETSRRLSAALRAASREEMQNLPLLKELLVNLAPVYSPLEGCCVPFDPELARRWANLHSLLEDNILQNFAYMAGYEESWLQQNLAAYILHEKYGHGFFYAQTCLGQQLSILYRHGLLRKADAKRSPFPHPRHFYEDQHGRRAIEALSHSTIVLNEGFAAWVELQILPQMSAEIRPAAYRRKVFLMEKDRGLETIARKSEYFKRFPNFQPSRYQEGYDWLTFIQGYFDEPWAPKCVVQAMIKAADVHLGITEVEGTIQFGTSARDMEKVLLEEERDDARCDMRLRRIHAVLREHQDWLRAEQQRLQCYRECPHHDCPVNAIIAERLNW
jgi:hypothetical protein